MDNTYAEAPDTTVPDPPGYREQGETTWEENRVNPPAQSYNYYGDPTYQTTGRSSNPPGYTWRQGRWAQSAEADSRNDPHFELLDMDKRDPNELNPHITYKFNEVIGEPEGAHSADCVWQNSFNCFHIGANCCYTFLTYICAIPLAFCWGCQFACLTFNHIWCVTPYLRAFNVNFYCTARLFSTIVHCLCDPLYESASLLFSKIFVNRVDNAEPFRSRPIEEINLLIQSPVNMPRNNRNSSAIG